MRKPGFLMIYLLLIAAQVLLNNFCNFSLMLTVTFLPVMILCIPIDKGPIFSMVAAFATGFAVDFLSDGMLGISSLALVLVGLLRKPVIQLVFGSEVFSRAENISVRRQGFLKMLLGNVLCTAIFLLVYILVDGAGSRPFWYNAGSFLFSLLASTLVSYFIADLLTSDSGRWK